MPTIEQVDQVGNYGPVDIEGTPVIISRWQSDSVEGRPIPTGRWYAVQAPDGHLFGLIDASGGLMYAFEPFAIGVALGATVRTLDEGIRILVSKRRP
ncbi:hypothetical protein [Agreia bicolorata]|uniref:WG containing repeat-containing protein n=1 Tax=Agreia bicolorata TaxID=110935 RepID=A0ABR5CHW9_9MICO|nr:hypothetical protein [Agreia bicolorata]KJC65199.1 hypothetical protein TZ00_06685 [Agreia bicolorata]